MSTLFIIGNGFDLHHKLNTSYKLFGTYLKSSCSDIYENLIEIYGFPDINEEDSFNIWGEFENSLSYLDGKILLESCSDLLANPSSVDFKDRDWNTFAVEIELFSNKMTIELFQALKDFIKKVNYPASQELSEVLLKLNKEAKYLNFNYTETLSKYYQISSDQILHIHGNASVDGETLILGHGINPENFKDSPEEPPSNLSDDELDIWKEDQNAKFDLSYEMGKQELFKHYEGSFKNTSEIIKSNSAFFEGIKDVDEVFILGHSLSKVDIPYIEHIRDSIQPNSQWTVSAYNDEEKKSHKQKMRDLYINENCLQIIDLNSLV